jgi:hypothetical protein
MRSSEAVFRGWVPGWVEAIPGWVEADPWLGSTWPQLPQQPGAEDSQGAGTGPPGPRDPPAGKFGEKAFRESLLHMCRGGH